LPLYDMDICYNLFKRLLQDTFGKTDVIVKEDLFKYYIDAYNRMALRLHENDYAYREHCDVKINVVGSKVGSKGNQSATYSFYDAFCECPYMKWLGITGNDLTLGEKEKQLRAKVSGILSDGGFWDNLTKYSKTRRDTRVNSLRNLGGYYD